MDRGQYIHPPPMQLFKLIFDTIYVDFIGFPIFYFLSEMVLDHPPLPNFFGCLDFF